MPRTCSVCVHRERDEIDNVLLAGQVSLRNMAERYGTSATALHRHKSEHLPTALIKAAEAAEVASADSLLDQVRALQAKALGIFDKAEATGDLRTALAAIREARGSMELVARMVGELGERKRLEVSLTTNTKTVEEMTDEELLAIVNRGE